MDKYILDISRLEVGDIILTAQDGLISKAVRFVTKSDYSHAMLYVGDCSVIHSDGNGVHSKNPQRMLFDEPTYAEVLRLAVKPDLSAIQRACSFARSQIGREYSVPDAIMAKTRPVSARESNRQFCSRLVAQAFDYAGVKLVGDPDYCTPQEIFESTLLMAVEGCIRVAAAQELAIAKSEGQLGRQDEATNSFLSMARGASGDDLQDFGQVTQFLMKNPRFDRDFSAALRRSGYLDLWKMDLVANPWRYDRDYFSLLPISKLQLAELAEAELKMAENQLRQREIELGKHEAIYQMAPLEYFGLKVELYETLVKTCNRRISAAGAVLAIRQEEKGG
ncbi:MAG: YiiX/YebB-like N1pC/P60 family cysteine hydrolase [Pseudomonadota bacterium]